MRIAYLECFSGVSGDMMLGALLHAGVSEELLRQTMAALNIDAELHIHRVDRSGISATKVEVLENGHSEPSHSHPHSDEAEHSHDHGHSRNFDAVHEHPAEGSRIHAEHVHDHHSHPDHHHGDSHQHDHSHETRHEHGRSLSVIRTIIAKANIPEAARNTAIRAFELLGEAEARIHNVPIEEIHFHEVGAVDAIVDIVCAAVGCHTLGVDGFVCSPLNVGGGMVECAHGKFPVPAPATLELLHGVPIYSSGVDAELVTPTGAAILRALNCTFSAFPQMKVESTGYGAGTRNPSGRPNVLRISIGELVETGQPLVANNNEDSEAVTVLETTIDDLTPQVMGYVTERLLAEGALDVFVIPAQMKKNRPGSLLTALCDKGHAQRLREILFVETSTIGIRSREEQRHCLQREIVAIGTQWGTVRVKEARLNGTVTNFAPEYEDCRKVAETHTIPLKQVQQETIAAYLRQRGATGDKTGSQAPHSKSQVA